VVAQSPPLGYPSDASAIDIDTLHTTLHHSFSADAALRNNSEAVLKSLKFVKGSTVLLLRIAGEKQVQFEVRQAAAIQLKNICRECWAGDRVQPKSPQLLLQGETDPIPPTPPAGLLEEDRVAVRSGTISALVVESETSVRDLLAETINCIAVHDYPERWPEALPTLLSHIRTGTDTGDALRVHNALLALRKLVRRYEYRSKEQRGPLADIVRHSFPLLLPLGEQLVGANSLEAAMMLKQILKIFWSSTQFYLTGITTIEEIGPWFDIIFVILKKTLPEASTGLEPLNQPTAVEERNAWPWWKLKKWGFQIMSRLFARYGMPKVAENEDGMQVFAEFFSTKIATRFLDPICETLALRSSGQFCSDRVVQLCLAYIETAVELSNTYKLLKPHLDFLLYQVCFPTMCLTEADVELFDSDPHEFIHRTNNPMLDYYEPRMAAITVMVSLVKNRGQPDKLLEFLTGCLTRYATAPPDQKKPIEKDGALLAFGSLEKFLKSKKKYASQLEGLMVTSVFPEFNSEVAYLRCRACWMVQYFAKIPWSDDGTNIRTLIQLVLPRLSDPSLPVQIEASKALRSIILEVDAAEEVLLPVLPQILTEYFRIMNEIGNDEVVQALEAIIDKFGDHIGPHAVTLVNQLATSFSNYCEADDDDDDAAMAAIQCLECISTVLRGICDRPDMFTLLEPLLVPLCKRILSDEGDLIEYLESSIDILTFLTLFQDKISPQLWECFPLLYMAFDLWALDYVSVMVGPFENYIIKDTATFLSAKTSEGIPFLDLIFAVVKKTVDNDRSGESYSRKAITLLMTVLHCCKGQVDNYVPLINEICLAKLAKAATAKRALTRISVYQVLASSLFYNPQLQLQEFEKRGVTEQVFGLWINDANEIEKWLPKKMTILGLCAVLQLPSSLLPQSIRSNLPAIFSMAVKLCEDLTNEKKNKKPIDGDDDDESDGGLDIGEDDGDDDGGEDGYDEDEDVRNPEDEAYMDALKCLDGTDFSKILEGDLDWDDEDDSDEYTSPLDQVNELVYLYDSLYGAAQKEPEMFQQIQSAVAPDVMEACQKLFADALVTKGKSAS